MVEDGRQSEEPEIILVLPAEALPRLEKTRAEAEVRFNDGIRNITLSGEYDPQQRPEVEVLLFEYIHTLWMAYAEEALNSACNTWIVRKHIEMYLDVVISKAFKEKHPDARRANWKDELQRFGSLTITFIKIKSTIWNEVQAALRERAEIELKELQAASNPNRAPTQPQPATATNSDDRNAVGRHVTRSKPEHLARASWLKERLRERGWNKHDVERARGPNHKTVQKILDGASVQEDILDKLAKALSKRHKPVDLLEIPQD